MPELKRRVDRYRWQSPTFTDVFSLDHVPSTDEEAGRIQRKHFEAVCAKAELPLAVVNMRLMPSYTLYDVRLGRVTDQQTLQAIFQRIEAHENWILGYLMLGGRRVRILQRTRDHHPLNLQHVITRAAFRRARSQAHFIAGVSLQQQILVRHWDQIGHLAIAGDDEAKYRFIRSLLLTQMLLHTPSELRVAFIGEGSDAYSDLQQAPHTLGSGTRNRDAGIRLLFGMSREYERRRIVFEQLNASDLDMCNHYLLEDGDAPLPRLILVLDTLVHGSWLEKSDAWFPYLQMLAQASSRYGIHMLLSLRGIHYPPPFDQIENLFIHRFVTRTAAMDTPFMNAITDFHPSLLRYVDGFFVEHDAITPMELAQTTDADIQAVVQYWQDMKRERINIDPSSDVLPPPTISDASDRYPLRDDDPENAKETAIAIERAAERLAHAEDTDSYDPTATNIPIISEPAPISDPSQVVQTHLEGMPDSHNNRMNRYRREEDSKPARPQIEVDIIHRAQALATYLGWLGRGPLMDVMALSVEEADTVIAILQARQILERSTGPTPHLKYRRKK